MKDHRDGDTEDCVEATLSTSMRNSWSFLLTVKLYSEALYVVRDIREDLFLLNLLQTVWLQALERNWT